MGLRLFFSLSLESGKSFFFVPFVLRAGREEGLTYAVMWYGIFYVEAFFVAVECISGWLFMVSEVCNLSTMCDGSFKTQS